MLDVELDALITLLKADNLLSENQIQHGGGLLWDPSKNPLVSIIQSELERRKVLPVAQEIIAPREDVIESEARR